MAISREEARNDKMNKFASQRNDKSTSQVSFNIPKNPKRNFTAHRS